MDYKSNRLLDIMASGLDGAELEDAIYGEIALLPSEMDKRFVEIYKQNGSKAATEWLYNYCVNNMYIKKDVLDKNPRFDTSNGLTITINKAKPEFRNPQKAKASMGHVDMGANVPWGLSALMHLPFIYIYNAENVRVTGGGTIRMDDTGTEWLDGNGYAWDYNITAGCSNIVHMIPLAIYRSNKVEVSDINIRRCSNWHVYIREASEIYLGNVDMAEVNDINGDGFDFSNATYNVVIDRCSLYSNDDAIVISTSVSDPRDDASLWRKPTPSGIDFSTHNFTIRRCNMFGGHGLTFIPWSSDAQDAYKVRIYDIDVRDCVLGGTSNAVGAWRITRSTARVIISMEHTAVRMQWKTVTIRPCRT